MNKKLVKKVILNFFLCFIGSVFMAILIGKLFEDLYPDLISSFFYFLIIGFPVVLPLSLLYFGYLVSGCYLYDLRWSFLPRNLILWIFGIASLSVILYLNWSFSKSRYYSFREYLREGNVFLAFSTIAFTQINLFIHHRVAQFKSK